MDKNKLKKVKRTLDKLVKSPITPMPLSPNPKNKKGRK